MKKLDLSNLSDEQLVHRELSLERELVAARFRLHTNQLEDTSKLGKLRRDIARIQTAARARERAQGLNRNTLRDRYSPTFQPAQLGGASDGGGFLQDVVDSTAQTE